MARAVFATFLVAAFPLGCSSAGSMGALERGEFVYECVSDVADAACGGGYFTDGASVPGAVALGAPFALRYENWADVAYTVAPASARHAEESAGKSSIGIAGPTAFFALDPRGAVYDLIHVSAEPVVAIGFDRAALSFDAPSELAEVAATPRGAGGVTLGGELDYSWQIADESVASVYLGGAQRVVQIRAEAPGATVLTVTAGGASADLEISVGGAGEEDR